MKIKIKNFNGELPDYLTVGKVYWVIYQYGYDLAEIVVDNGCRTIADISYCAHLNGGSWEIVE